MDFWDECLGEIADAPSPRTTASLFDELDTLPAPGATTEDVTSFLDPEPWRSFLDDSCPFRRRVKVTRKRSSAAAGLSLAAGTGARGERERKRGRTTLNFPPQYASAEMPLVPRRSRIAADPLAIPPSATATASADGLVDAATILGNVTTERQEAKEEGGEQTAVAAVLVDADGVVANANDGYLTPKLQARLEGMMSHMAPTSSAPIVGAIGTRRTTCGPAALRGGYSGLALPSVDAAVAAVTAAAAAYRTALTA